jgi:uncharacterized protein
VKLQPDPKSHLNTVTSYDANRIEINTVPYSHSVLVMPEGSVQEWPVTDFAALKAEHFELIAQKKPELVIFGAGQTIKFPNPALLAPLIKARIGFETMDTQAACRTYNILMGEGRLVLGAFILPQSLTS